MVAGATEGGVTKAQRRVLDAMAHGRRIKGVWAWTRTMPDGGRLCKAPLRSICGPFTVPLKMLSTMAQAGWIAKAVPHQITGRYVITKKVTEGAMDARMTAGYDLYVQALEKVVSAGCPHGCADEHCLWARRLRDAGLKPELVAALRAPR